MEADDVDEVVEICVHCAEAYKYICETARDTQYELSLFLRDTNESSTIWNSGDQVPLPWLY